MERIIKYPRTPHISGSKLQPGDEDISQIPFSEISDDYLVVEEKVDGANSAISFSESGELLLQSRGHFLTGGYRERHYDLLKVFAASHKAELYELLGRRYIMYGEWLYAKHKVYYDMLPDYFLEFDVLDRESGIFLSTERRREILGGSCIKSVPVLGEGKFKNKDELLKLLQKSLYVSDNPKQSLLSEVEKRGLDAERALAETDLSGLAEGLYVKAEANGAVTKRMKYVRYGYTQVTSCEDDWLSKPIIPNAIKE